MTVSFHRERAEEAIKLVGGSGIDALLLFPGADIGYFTGFFINPSERLAAALIPVGGDPVLLVNELERELRGQTPWVGGVEIWREHEDPVEALAGTIGGRNLASSAIGLADDAPWGWVDRLSQLLPETRFVNISGQLGALRMVKTPRELGWMRKACEITDAALGEGFRCIRTDMTERELADVITSEMMGGGGGETFCSVQFGERSALPHASSGDRRLREGDPILVDAGCTVNRYWSDITRTIFYGEPTARRGEIYELVLKANQAAYDSVRPGVACEDVDRAGREVISSAGHGDHFIHRLGHGVGLQVHEHPYIVRGNGLELRRGMTFTIEPGVYVVGELGVRVEDTVAVTDDGCERLTGFDRSLAVYPPG